MTNQVVKVDFQAGKLTETLTVARNRSRSANDAQRGRRHLTPQEVDSICQTIRKHSRYADRDELMVVVAFHHGYRVGELTDLKWQHIDLKSGQLSVKRSKNGVNTQHPIANKRELMLFRRLYRDQGKPTSGFLFRNERGGAVSTNGFQRMFNRYSEKATGTKWNAHALRHACGTTLINRGQDVRTVQVYMGHANIQNTVKYLHESTKQFESIEW